MVSCGQYVKVGDDGGAGSGGDRGGDGSSLVDGGASCGDKDGDDSGELGDMTML